MEEEFTTWEREEMEYFLRREQARVDGLNRARRERTDREATEARKAALRQAQKEAAHAADQQLRADSQRLELGKQERWELKGCFTKDEKLQDCLHSNFCAKVKHQKKIRCLASKCMRKVFIAFECPYCSSVLCQQCLTDCSQRRTKLATAIPSEESAPADDSGSGQESPVEECEQASFHDAHSEVEDGEASDRNAAVDSDTGPEPTQDGDILPNGEKRSRKAAKRAEARRHARDASKKEPLVVADEAAETDEQLAARLQQEWNEQVAREDLPVADGPRGSRTSQLPRSLCHRSDQRRIGPPN